MGKTYKVTVSRTYDTYFEIEAENEIDAEEKANMQFDELDIKGNEMYSNSVEVEEE